MCSRSPPCGRLASPDASVPARRGAPTDPIRVATTAACRCRGGRGRLLRWRRRGTGPTTCRAWPAASRRSSRAIRRLPSCAVGTPRVRVASTLRCGRAQPTVWCAPARPAQRLSPRQPGRHAPARRAACLPDGSRSAVRVRRGSCPTRVARVVRSARPSRRSPVQRRSRRRSGCGQYRVCRRGRRRRRTVRRPVSRMAPPTRTTRCASGTDPADCAAPQCGRGRRGPAPHRCDRRGHGQSRSAHPHVGRCRQPARAYGRHRASWRDRRACRTRSRHADRGRRAVRRGDRAARRVRRAVRR
ncbi:unannotated protein [freshwater metagenome]|uniref:Unannotated protein n=1 Tax=freshwater metagenome TaxID=449393 RepID=A0A6J6ZB20_9ZZZZ